MHGFNGKGNRVPLARAWKNLKARTADKVKITVCYK